MSSLTFRWNSVEDFANLNTFPKKTRRLSESDGYKPKRSWDCISPDLLELIIKRLSLEDFVTTSSVCSRWQNISGRNRRDISELTIPWLMLGNLQGSDTCQFYSLSNQKTHKHFLPEARGKRCFSSRGWIMTIGRDKKINLLNPLFRENANIELPGLELLIDFDKSYGFCIYSHYISKFALSACPGSSADYVVMIIYGAGYHASIWRPGDNGWTLMALDKRPKCDVIFYRGKFLTVDFLGQLITYDVNGAGIPNALVMTQLPDELMLRNHDGDFEQAYLVESSKGSLLVVSREGQQVDNNMNYGTFAFIIYEVNMEESKWTKMKSLGDDCIFLGYNSSFSIRVDERHYHALKPNCIYFTDDFLESYYSSKMGGGKDMGIYHLEDGRFERHFMGECFSHISPPQWLLPNFLL